MASEAPIQALRSALAVFAARPDLTDDARRQLALILAGHVEGLGLTPDGRLALSSAALAHTLSVATSTLVNWRRAGRRVGPPCVEVPRGKQTLVMYPVDGVQLWLRGWDFEGSYRPDSSVLAAFGISQSDREEKVAA